MKRENRKYNIRRADFDDFEKTPQYYNMPLIIEYRGKKQILGAGNSDDISVFRYGSDMVVLSTNFNLDYAGLQIIDFENFNDTDSGVFIQNIHEINTELHKDFFDYSDNSQADILAQYLDY